MNLKKQLDYLYDQENTSTVLKKSILDFYIEFSNQTKSNLDLNGFYAKMFSEELRNFLSLSNDT